MNSVVFCCCFLGFFAASIENKDANRKCKNDRTVLLPISIKIVSVKC